MITRLITCIGISLAAGVLASEPKVEEKTTDAGLTELTVLADDGKKIARYEIDLKTHHEPATSRTGAIKK